MFMNTAQQIVFDRINGNIGATVFDTAPFLPEAAPDTTFPYVVIGNDQGAPWDTDDTIGSAITVTLHFWSRSSGFAEVKTIMGAAYSKLHRASLFKTGYNVIDCINEFSEALSDPDGVTKHGVQRYRLTIQEA